MKKNPFSKSILAAAILIVAAIACSFSWLTPTLARTGKDKIGKAATPVAKVQKMQTEENELIDRLMGDGLINQVRGFIVEKKQNKLYINGQEQSSKIADKYLAGIMKEEIRVQVYSFSERLQQHPDESFIQILLPVSLSSPCVDYKPKRDTC